MSSLLTPDSSHLLRRRRKLNNGKTAAAAAAAVLVLLPSGSAQHSALPLLSSDPSSSLTAWPTTPSPLSSPEVEFNPFVIQLDHTDPDIHLEPPLSSSPSQHSATQILITSSDDPTLAVKTRRAKLAKRASLGTDIKDPSTTWPEPFDTSLGTHFESSTCGPFIEHMVTDPEFQACHPFSLLLSTSNGFFHSLRGSPGAPSLAKVLSATCTADVDACGILIDRFAALLSGPDACGSELEKHNALAVEALGGLQNFRLMRAAGCMQADAPTLGSNSTRLNPRASSSPNSSSDQSTPTTSLNTTTADKNRTSTAPIPSTNATSTSASLPSPSPTPPQPSQTYCFEAAANSTRPDDLYYYYLPSGTSLPSGTQPTCDTCTQTLMKLYSAAAANTSLGIHDTYPAARTVTNAHCGPGFAPAPANRASGASRSNTVPLVSLLFSLLLSAFL